MNPRCLDLILMLAGLAMMVLLVFAIRDCTKIQEAENPFQKCVEHHKPLECRPEVK